MQNYNVPFNLDLVLYDESWKYVHTLPYATQALFLEDNGLELTQGHISSWMKEKNKYFPQTKNKIPEQIFLLGKMKTRNSGKSGFYMVERVVDIFQTTMYTRLLLNFTKWMKKLPILRCTFLHQFLINK